MSKFMSLVFIGPAGSGKGTQADILKKEYSVCHLSTGDMLRDAVKNGTELGKKAGPLMAAGKVEGRRGALFFVLTHAGRAAGARRPHHWPHQELARAARVQQGLSS